tara:strand:- start:437 stop:688 length:252 start_codon:yes stop_codon:yes gene_type:complete
MSVDELYKYYKELLVTAQVETATRVMTSSSKRGYSRSFGMSIPSINDRVRDYNARCRAINDMCVEATGKSLIHEEDVKPLKLK